MDDMGNGRYGEWTVWGMDVWGMDGMDYMDDMDKGIVVFSTKLTTILKNRLIFILTLFKLCF